MASSLINKESSLQHALGQFIIQFRIVLEHCANINAISHDLYAFDESLSEQLQTLEDVVTEKIVMMMLEDDQEELFTIEQLSTILPGYRDTLSQIALSLTKTKQEHLIVSEEHQEMDEHVTHRCNCLKSFCRF